MVRYGNKQKLALIMDFTHSVYRDLLKVLCDTGYSFFTFEELSEKSEQISGSHVVLRHDVDRFPRRSLALAELEAELGIRSTYFFRVKPVSFSEKVIARIKELGHEIGYHYEVLSDAQGDIDLAWKLFVRNLTKFEQFGGVKTISMHGRPFSAWDNRSLWKHFNYRKLGIKLEVYMDIDWSKYLYLTDTGRTWNGNYSIRDNVQNGKNFQGLLYTTRDVIRMLRIKHPNIIISTHPERWANSVIDWFQVLVVDSMTNVCKTILKRIR